MRSTTLFLEFYDVESNDDIIFSMSIPHPDIVLLTLHQPKESVFFKIGNNKIIKFIVVKPRQIYHTIKEQVLTTTTVRIPVRQSNDDDDDYKNIPNWWKDIEIVTV